MATKTKKKKDSSSKSKTKKTPEIAQQIKDIPSPNIKAPNGVLLIPVKGWNILGLERKGDQITATILAESSKNEQGELLPAKRKDILAIGETINLFKDATQKKIIERINAHYPALDANIYDLGGALAEAREQIDALKEYVPPTTEPKPHTPTPEELEHKNNREILDANLPKTGSKQVTGILAKNNTLDSEISQKIGSLIIKSLSTSDAAIELLQQLKTIDCVEGYIAFVANLASKHELDTFEVSRYLETLQGIQTDKTQTYYEPVDITVDSARYNALTASLGHDNRGTIYYASPQSENENMAYTRALWTDQDILAFITTPQKRIVGKITAPAWPGPRSIPLAQGWERVMQIGNFVQTQKDVTYYNASKNASWTLKEQLVADFYGYYFISDDDKKQYLILSPKEIHNYQRTEVVVGQPVMKADDFKLPGDTKLRAYTNIIHLYSVELVASPKEYVVSELKKITAKMPEIHIAFKSEGIPSELLHVKKTGNTLHLLDYVTKRLKDDYTPLEHSFQGKPDIVSESVLQEYLHAKVFRKWRHPRWFEQLVLAWLFSGKRDDYPLHILVFQDGSGGKTFVQYGIVSAMGLHQQDIWDGSESTIKSLVPNYGMAIADVGFIVKQKIVAAIDEFLGRMEEDNSNRPISLFDVLKSILEHKQSIASSGKGSIPATPTAKCFFTTNPRFAIKDLPSMMDKLTPPVVERVLPYFMGQPHYEFVEGNRERIDDMPLPDLTMLPEKWFQKLVEWSYTWTVKGIDNQRLRTMRKKLASIPTYDSHQAEMVKKYVDARLAHHMALLLDGLCKYRNFSFGNFSEDMTPTDEDYQELETIMDIVAHSWLNNFNILELTHDTRVRQLAGRPREIYHWIRESGGKVIEEDLWVYALKSMHLEDKDAKAAVDQLCSWQVIVRKDGHVYCYWRDEVKGNATTQTMGIRPNTNAHSADKEGILDLVRQSKSITKDQIKRVYSNADSILDELLHKGYIGCSRNGEYYPVSGQTKVGDAE